VSSASLQVRVSIRDALGSRSRFTIGGLNVTALPTADLSRMLQYSNAIASNPANQPLNSTLFYRSLRLALELSLAGGSGSSGQVLGLLTNITQTVTGGLDEETALSIVNAVLGLSGNLTTTQEATAVLKITQLVANATASGDVSQELGDAILEAVSLASDVLAAAVGQVSAVRGPKGVSAWLGNILDTLARSVASKSRPSSGTTTFGGGKIGTSMREKIMRPLSIL
jgi:hypothetical protein